MSDNIDKCDTRLSRAARHAWLKDALPKMEAYLKKEGLNQNSSGRKSDTKVRSLLEKDTILWRRWKDVAGILKISEENCRLHPDRDVAFLWQNEISLNYNHSEADRRWVLNRHYVHRKGNAYIDPDHAFLHSCAICGKVFVSRYYLDQHIQSHHHNFIEEAQKHNNGVEKKNLECWADTWCSHNGGSRAMCERQALLLEPYYGPGSGGWSRHDSTATYHKWHSQLTLCDDQEEQQRAQYCYDELLQPCFSHTPSLLETLNKHVCRPHYSCQSILTNLVLDSHRRHGFVTAGTPKAIISTSQTSLHNQLLYSSSFLVYVFVFTLLSLLYYFGSNFLCNKFFS
jgi:hypothetical protein